MRTAVKEAGRSYFNPDQGEFGHFEVWRTEPKEPGDFWQWAKLNQDIINQALNEQLNGFTPEEVNLVANPDDIPMVAKQVSKLKTDPVEKGAVFAHAKLTSPKLSLIGRQAVVAIGKLQYADIRSERARRASPNEDAARNLVDLRGIYTRPQFKGGDQKSLQYRGYGTATFHFELKQFPYDLRTHVIGHPDINPRFRRLLEEDWGFDMYRSWQARFAGRLTTRAEYFGPFVGKLIEKLEEKDPWLMESQPLQAAA
jgi:hypothetical protein